MKPEYGTNADYLTACIARDHPAILTRMQAGEYASVRARLNWSSTPPPGRCLRNGRRRAVTGVTDSGSHGVRDYPDEHTHREPRRVKWDELEEWRAREAPPQKRRRPGC